MKLQDITLLRQCVWNIKVFFVELRSFYPDFWWVLGAIVLIRARNRSDGYRNIPVSSIFSFFEITNDKAG